jgi:lipoyl(octanoyl) transferase
MRELRVHALGRVEYEDGLRLMQLWAAARRRDDVPDALFLVEHPPVITKGRGAGDQNILVSAELLASAGVELHETDRGGDVTYHGPGQVVGYPVLDLSPDRRDVRRYVRDLEETMIRACADYGIAAGRADGIIGAWVGDEKIGAIGVHIARWITTHGFAFNAAPDLAHFGLIVPCGIPDRGVTSLAKLLGRAPGRAEVEGRLARHFAEVFERDARAAEPDLRSVQVVVAAGEDVLLLQRNPERGRLWQPVTGRIEAGESARDAAARELREETGFDADVQPLGYAHAFLLDPEIARRFPVFCHEEAFVARLDAPRAPRLDPREHTGARWLPWRDALAEVPYAGFRRAIAIAFTD